MKILLVYELYTPHVGGGEIAVQHLAEGLAAHGHQVDLVTSRLPHTPAEETVNGVKVHRVDLPRWASRYWFMLCSFKSIYRLVKSADLIHTFTYTAVLPAWLAAALRRKPKILTVHEYWGELWQQFSGLSPVSAWLHRIFERTLFLLTFDHTIAVSNFTRLRLVDLGVSEKKLTTIYQGIDQDLFHPIPVEQTERLRTKMNVSPDTFVYLFFGRPGLSKGVEYLLQAVPIITQHIPNSQLWLLLGAEPADQYTRCLQLITHLHIQNQVNVLSPVPRAELPTYIAAAQAVVVPSLSEGFGFSVAESCATGTPVVASRVGSIPEVISGLFRLIDPKKPTDIAEAVINVKIGKLTPTPSKTFSWQTTVRDHEQIYQKIVKHA